ncbi:MAG: amino acid ABC transporter ATP-binding protein [Planctomycetota bacterium]|jgi:ABC-type polar amino acid transport system ATPase subunit|nr:amino acid ABC transporter ATP-binding protein [Planctomycetota bacterium]
MSGRIVELENVDKRYGEVTALADVTLRVDRGEQVVIIGSSGSGKSTLLRCINHLEAVDRGKIAINGATLVETVDGRVKYRREGEIRKLIMQTAMVFQHFNLFGHLTCLDNIAIAPIEIKRENPAEVRERARELLKLVGLEQKAGAYPGQLSGGQKQRVAIARALAIRPSILLFDEPTSALDPEITGEVLKVIRDLAAQGYTMMLVTHEMGFAREVATRAVFMDNGRIIEEGPPGSVFGAPESGRLRLFLKAVIKT